MIRIFNRYWSVAAAAAVASEILLLALALVLAFTLRLGPGAFSLWTPWELLARAGLLIVTVTLTFYFTGLYDFTEHLALRQLGIRIWRGLGISAVALWTVYYAFPGLSMGRGVFALAILIGGVLICLERLLLRWVLTREHLAERILIVGADEDAVNLARQILAREHLGYHVIGFLADDSRLQGVSLVNPTVIGTTSQACDLAVAHRATRVVVAQRDYRGALDMDSLLACKTSGIRVDRGYSYYEKLTGQIALEGLRKSWLVFSPGFVVSPHILFWKRTLDISAAVIGLTLASPVMLLTALAVRLESKGPILFSQERTGKNGKVFTLWKFRSMVVDAETDGKAVWAGSKDPRITRVGFLLRTLRIDELPQLWNVLVGDMSLVGPRPERPVFVEQLIGLNALYEQRLVVRPGLTGWAQIKAPYAASFEASLEKLQFDLYYIKNLSIALDISIVLSTLRAVLFGRGAR